MPVKEFDINEYIASLNLSEEDKKAVAPIFAKPEVVAEIKRGWNSKAEGSALMNEVSEAKKAAALEKAEADRIKTEAEAETSKARSWADALKKYETDTQQTAAEKLELEAKTTAYEKYLTDIGVEPTRALEGVQIPKPPVRQDPPVPPVKEPPAIDPKLLEGFVQREVAEQAIGLVANLPFQLNEVQFRHLELYGKPAPAAEINKVREIYLNPENKRHFVDIAAETFHFAERETAIAAENLEKEATRRAEEMFTKRMSELNLPSAALDSLTPASVESAVKFASKAFSDNGSRASDANSTQVSAEEMSQFLQINEELNQQGIRPSTF
jgi:hypothetical protein